MVGVPGRSKACNTCKQRRVACSQEKPECKTCIKAGRACAGYQRERIFVHDLGAVYEAPKQKPKPPSKPGSASLTKARKSGSNTPPLQLDRIKKSHSECHDGNLELVAPPPMAAIYSQRIIAEFAANFLPPEYFNERPASNWILMVPTLPDLTPALEKSVLAVSVAKLARLNNDAGLLRESLNLYGQGLRELQLALWNPKMMRRDETVAACMALVTYEVLECPDQTTAGWMSHMKGCAKLFELKGPNAYSSDFGHKLFLSFRLIEIQQAFVERRPTYLASPEWVETPFKNRTKSTYHELLDIMASIANVVGDGYQTLAGPIEGRQPIDHNHLILVLASLIERCWKADAELDTFYAGFTESSLGPLYSPELSTGWSIQEEEDMALGKVFPVAFQFPNLRTAHICMIYWATSLILWAGMSYAYRLTEQIAQALQLIPPADEKPAEERTANGIPNSIKPAKLPLLGYRLDLPTPAKKICQSIEYCLREEHREMGARIVSFPLKVAIETLHDAPGCERESLWAQDAMRRVQQSGIRIMNHLENPITDHAFVPG